MPETPDIFEILAQLREALARVETRLDNIPKDSEFAEHKIELEKKIFAMTTSLNTLQHKQKLNRSQISTITLYLKGERRRRLSKESAKIKEKKHDIKSEKRTKKEFWMDLLRGAIIAAITAALTYWITK